VETGDRRSLLAPPAPTVRAARQWTCLDPEVESTSWRPASNEVGGDYLPFDGGLFPRPPPDGLPVLLGAFGGDDFVAMDTPARHARARLPPTTVNVSTANAPSIHDFVAATPRAPEGHNPEQAMLPAGLAASRVDYGEGPRWTASSPALEVRFSQPFDFTAPEQTSRT
jgi:hypothetical protein